MARKVMFRHVPMPAEERKKEQALKSHGSALVRVAKHARQVGGWWPVWTFQEHAEHWVARPRAQPQPRPRAASPQRIRMQNYLEARALSLSG
jgi:uncharacterized protein (DUF2384 family)